MASAPSDTDVLAAIAVLRAQGGSVTYRQLAERLDTSVGTIQNRVRVLIAAGKVIQGETAGSLRLAELPADVAEVGVVISFDRDTGQALGVRLA